MPKISLLPPQSVPTINDKAPIVSGGVTDYVLLSDLIALFFANATGANSPVTRQSENQFDYIVRSTGVWSGDSVGVNRNASMTAATIYINGRRIPIAAVTARTFTASKDTYVDVLDNLDGTGTLVYTEVTNNAASPALAANSIRVAIIVTGATTIAAAGSVNQGQETMILPIASSVPYAVTDSLGNVICPRDPNKRTLGYRIITAAVSATSSGSAVQVTGLSSPVIVPLTRKIKISAFFFNTFPNAAANVSLTIWDGTVGSGTQIAAAQENAAGSSDAGHIYVEATITPTAASKTYNIGWQTSASTYNMQAAATTPCFVRVELA